MMNMRKALNLLLVLCLATAPALLAWPTQALAATTDAVVLRASSTKKVSLSRKKATLRIKGDAKVLRVKNATRKVKWYTTNKKIAFVKKKYGKYNQKALIKAGKKTGTCYIKAKVGKKTLKCKVSVKKAYAYSEVIYPETPEIVVETRELSDSSKDLTAGMTAVAPTNAEPGSTFISDYTGFSLNLLKKTLAADSTSNILLSPDSVSTAFAMVENGAAGNTLSEMEHVLSPNMTADDFNRQLSTINRRLSSSEAFIYCVSNSIWAREAMVDVREDFLQTNKNYHDAEFYVAPFDEQTVQDINSWVYNKSRNMIDGILDSLSEDMRMVVLNTVAFEGQWAHKFDAYNIKNENFTSYNGTKKKVPMLYDCDNYQYLEMKGGKGFAKYYATGGTDNGIAFVGILPPAKTDIDAFVSSLSGTDFINGWNGKKVERVALKLPKFKYDYSVDMGDLLKEMGIVTAFTDDADFTRMANPTPESPGLCISKVLHKTHIDLDENGTRAAAATAVLIEKSSAYFDDSPIELNFDRPFMYALVDTTTGLPLFIGVVKVL